MTQTPYCYECRWMGNVVQVVEDIVPPNLITEQQKSHVHRFAYRLHYTMTQHLRDVVLQSVEAYKKLWDEYTIKDMVEAEDIDDFATRDPIAPEEAKATEEKKPPFFFIKFTVDYEDQFVFAPTLEEIQDVVLQMLDDICDNVEGMEDLISCLDPKLIGENKPKYILTISKTDPPVEAARAVIKVKIVEWFCLVFQLYPLQNQI